MKMIFTQLNQLLKIENKKYITAVYCKDLVHYFKNV